jgi:tetratricopeptide (TPR) repeat protein
MKYLAIFRTIFPTVLRAALLIVCLVPTARAAGTWTSVHSQNFLLLGDADEKDIRDTAARLEQFREMFRRLFPALNLGNGTQTNVIVFKNPESFRPFKPKRAEGSADDAVAGFFVPGEAANYIALSYLNAKSEPNISTVYHEYVHYLLSVNFRRTGLPPWLNEGLAEYFQTARIENGLLYLGSPRPERLALLRTSTLIPLKTLVEMDDESLKSSSDKQRALFYAEAWAAVHFLLNSGAQATAVERLNKLLGLFQGKESAEKAFQTDYASAEKALRIYIDQPSLPVAAVTHSAKFEPPAATSSAVLSESEVNAYLGDLSHHTGDLASAETHLRKALALEPGSTLANSSLGTLLVRQQKFAEAKKYLEKAAASERADFLTHFNYAYILSQLEMDVRGYISQFSPETEKRMRASLEKAIALNPNFAQSYRLLAFVDLVNEGDLEEAITLLRKGIAVRPGDQDFVILLAQVLLRREKYTEAKQIAERVRKTTADPRLRSEADEILRTVDEYFAVGSVNAEDRSPEFRNLPRLLFLKRSAVSEADIARFEEDRRINNLNLILERPKAGEKQIVGYIDRVSCTNDGIDYGIRTAGGRLGFTSKDFGDLRLSVLTEGQNAYKIDCGASFEKQLTVLTYRPTSGTKTKAAGQLTAITFVPDYFRLKTPEEMSKARLVVIEDDTLRGSRLRNATRPNTPDKASPK